MRLDGVEGWMAPNCARQISAMLPPNFSHVSGRLHTRAGFQPTTRSELAHHQVDIALN